METDEELADTKKASKKHNSEELHSKVQNNPKKVKLFSAKEFRKKLQGNDKVTALMQFLTAISESNGHDYVLEYLESGGNCLELLQILELDSTLSPVLVFELVAHVLLKITASGPQYQSAAYESCRYILNNYMTVINKMLGLSSSTQERKMCLKLLTAMVTFSSTLAKDILVNVNFHSTNVELLTKNTGEKQSVRDHFIHFLTAFLVNGSYPSLSVLLEKKGFITSIIKGLQYDAADTVCVVISAMKNHILQNQAVSKSTKMKVFNTLVVRDIVNLYNWKGPAALKTQWKNKTVPAVDEYAKSKVSECVHDFLLVLCTSHKHGVIFRDNLLGLGKKHQNALMYTVLESLERPWEHSYACELVTKICAACPDLTKTMWTNLKSSLEPRLTQKWLNAMKFAKILLEELQPKCIEFCARDLSVNQLAQVIQILSAPLPVLKTLIAEDHNFDNTGIKRHIISLLLHMLRSLNSYLDTSRTWLSFENHAKLTTFTTNYVVKYFPDAKTILSNWEVEETTCKGIENATITDEKYLEIIFDIFDLYNKIAPQLLDSLNSIDFHLTDFLTKLSNNCSDDQISTSLQVKMINIFIDLEPSNFSPNKELFSFVVLLLFKFYYATIDSNALAVLNKLFTYTGAFEGCLHEVNIWINGILNIKHFDESIVQSLVQMLQMSVDNIIDYTEELSHLKTEGDIESNVTRIIEKLKNTDIAFDDEGIILKHKQLSPMILGLVSYLRETTLTKGLKNYVSFVLLNLFHHQTQMETLVDFVQKYEVIPEKVKEYTLSCIQKGEVTFFLKGKIRAFQPFTEEFISGNIEDALKNIDISTYPDLSLDLLQSGIFYLNNVVDKFEPIENVFENCFKFINYLVETKLLKENYIETILAHPTLARRFDLLNANDRCTKFLLDVITLLLDSGFEISQYLNIYREKLFSSVLKITRKPKKYSALNLVKVLRQFGLNYEQCNRIVTTFTPLIQNDLILNIVSYTLKQLAALCENENDMEPLEGDVIEKLTLYFVDLNKSQSTTTALLSESFLNYFKVFPHLIKYIHSELVPTLINLNEYHKDNVALLVFLLERNIGLFDTIRDNLENLCSKKAVLLPVLQVLVQKNVEESVLKQIFEQFEAPLTKALVKPQKAGQHFHSAYQGLTVLIEKFLPLENCLNLADKVQKFEVTECFHVKLLEVVYNKVVDSDVNAKLVNNIILTFVHLQMQVFKRNAKGISSESDLLKVTAATESFNNMLLKLRSKTVGMDLKSTSQNETLKSYVIYCLKFGVSGQSVLLKSIRNVINLLASSMEKETAKLFFDMLLSHSQFLDVMTSEHGAVKLEVLSLFLVFCRNWNEFMERFHIPALLAAYRAMINGCDRIIWTLLKMYAENSSQTNFHEFKPLLWGPAAANHYFVRQDVERSLWRQPKMRDVLDILEENLVLFTVVNHPLKKDLQMTDDELTEIPEIRSYDLKFLLPVFSQLLAHEQQVQTYTFTRSGALSLTVAALSHEDEMIRDAARHVLSRFHYHVDANQHGKDNLLWIRYIETVCQGIKPLPDMKLNNFSAIYLSKMALVLTQPTYVMYVPMSQHLTAKHVLDFSTVPELYTFLHSSDVNYREHRTFILELLRDGLRTDRDLTDFLRSMASKLFLELLNSTLSDIDTKLLILDVIWAACKIPLGVRLLCESHSLLVQLYNSVCGILLLGKLKQEATLYVGKIVSILLAICKTLKDSHTCFMIFNCLMEIVKDNVFGGLSKDDQKRIFEGLYLVCMNGIELFTNEVVDILLQKSGDRFCKYVVKYGTDFVDVNNLSSNDRCNHLRLLLVHKMKV